jgi:hypothetical protein
VATNSLSQLPVKNNIQIANTHMRFTVTKVLKYILNKVDKLAAECKL